MAKLITTEEISEELKILIQTADKTLYIISPYLKLSKPFQKLIAKRNEEEKKTIFIYGKNYELTPDQYNFLISQRYVYINFHKDLHAKCYLNDYMAIVTSMNFYDYSMRNNEEMGILFDSQKNGSDKAMHINLLNYVKGLEDNCIKRPFTLIPQQDSIHKSENEKEFSGFCIRTGTKIPYNPKRPFCKKAFEEWNIYENEDYPEKYCHFSGEESFGETSFNKPILKKNWTKAKEVYKF